jgi:hypothetical protein
MCRFSAGLNRFYVSPPVVGDVAAGSTYRVLPTFMPGDIVTIHTNALSFKGEILQEKFPKRVKCVPLPQLWPYSIIAS